MRIPEQLPCLIPLMPVPTSQEKEVFELLKVLDLLPCKISPHIVLTE